MDVRQLRYFVAAVDSGSFVGAAAQLRIAQPAISRQVMLLEEELGEQLLERSVRGVRITAAGEIVYEKARSILQQVSALESHFSGPQERRRHRLRLGVPPSFSAIANAESVDALAPQLPRTDLYIQEMWTGQIAAMIANRSLDLGIVCQSQLANGYWRQPLNRERLYLIEAAGGGSGPVTLAEVAARTLVLPTPIQGMRAVIDQHFAVHGVPLAVAQEADSWGTIFSLTKLGRAATILPRREAWEGIAGGTLVARPIDTAPMNTFYLAASRALNDQPELLAAAQVVHGWLAALLRDDLAE
jgi:LysR family nitrogen assimilation transcriptional regulator